MKKEEKYNPYCSVCGACGEQGCCSPLICQQHPSGSYCKSYLMDLKHGYHMSEFILDNKDFSLPPNINDIIDEEWNKSYDTYFKYE